MRISILTALTASSVIMNPTASGALDWSTTELHYQAGQILNPFTDDYHSTQILTFQHASGWKYGTNFFFIDLIDDNHDDGYNDTDFYGELYLNFSLGKITGYDFSVGALKDIGLIAGLNVSGDANAKKYLPGIRFSWDVAGFSYLNTDITAYIDDSDTQQKDSFMFDVNWAYPFDIGNHSFAIQGHAEYIGAREGVNNSDVEAHILAQPQFRWDVGKALLGTEDTIFAGIEYQYWNNKLGTKNDENTVQALVVWRF